MLLLSWEWREVDAVFVILKVGEVQLYMWEVGIQQLGAF
jgi:hypothetical protein